MPRYPNVWFLVHTALAPSHRDAVKLVTDGLRDSMRLREYFPPFDNPEGCDFEARIEHLQPWEDRTARALQHAHAFHMRYYYSALAANQLEQVTLNTGDLKGTFYRFAASVHYEVEHSNPNHADVEACPICGRTGEYRDLRGNLVELVHDPLGLELLLSGTIRDQRVQFEDYGQREVGSIAALGARFRINSLAFSGHDRRSEHAADWCRDTSPAMRAGRSAVGGSAAAGRQVAQVGTSAGRQSASRQSASDPCPEVAIGSAAGASRASSAISVEIAPPQVELFDGLRRVESLRINPLGVCEQVQPEIPGHLFDELRQAIGSGGSQQPGMAAQAFRRMTRETERNRCHRRDRCAALATPIVIPFQDRAL